MNQVFLYQGDFISLLSLIFYLLTHHIKPYQIKNRFYSPNLLEEIIDIEVAYDDSIISNVIDILGYYNFRMMYYVFLSNEEYKELFLYYFLRNSLKYQRKIGYQRNLKCVREVLRVGQYVSHELHKMKGFLRFQELENQVLYAEIESENNILFDLSLHFQKRLTNEFWIIKDVAHGLVSCYDKNKFVIVSESDFLLSTKLLSQEEKKYESLWKEFYKTIGIAERKNDRCRMNFMPKKYWKYITEVRDEL